jgi:hypothetical protein
MLALSFRLFVFHSREREHTCERARERELRRDREHRQKLLLARVTWRDMSRVTCHVCGVKREWPNSNLGVNSWDGRAVLQSVERLDVSIGRFVRVSDMHCGRASPALAVLDGFLYAIGGFDGNDWLADVRFSLLCRV